jgi:hypothetical protein
MSRRPPRAARARASRPRPHPPGPKLRQPRWFWEPCRLLSLGSLWSGRSLGRHYQDSSDLRVGDSAATATSAHLALDVRPDGASTIGHQVLSDPAGRELEAVEDRDRVLGFLYSYPSTDLVLLDERPISSHVDDVAARRVAKAKYGFRQLRHRCMLTDRGEVAGRVGTSTTGQRGGWVLGEQHSIVLVLLGTCCLVSN